MIFTYIFKTYVLFQKSWCSPSAWSSGERSPSVGEISETIPHDVLWESGEDEKEKDKTLAEPEFPALWSQEHDLHKVKVGISLIWNKKEKKKSGWDAFVIDPLWI